MKRDVEIVLNQAYSVLDRPPLPTNDSVVESDVLFVLNCCFESLVKDIKYSSEVFHLIDAVIDKTWQKLNTGCWTDVPQYFRDIYAYASFLKALNLLKYTLQDTDKRLGKNLRNVLETIDRGLLLGCSYRDELSNTASSLCKILSKDNRLQASSNLFNRNVQRSLAVAVPRIESVNSLQCPSIELFSVKHFATRTPAKLTGCIKHWPALKTWQNVNYIFEKIGPRLVPIEIGNSYTSSCWSQKLVTVRSFLENCVLLENPKQVGYLAQHQLFNQIPELLMDIREPEYCVLSENYEEKESAGVDVNAWFGPANTLSPLHYDTKHNFLVQVVGSKRVLLVDPKWNENVYPYDDLLLFNTAQVDPENPDYINFPKFEDVEFIECLLEPGDMLYIPPKWWHHVRSLSTSFSVSFWWGNALQ